MTKLEHTSMYEAIENHGKNLNAIFNTGVDNIALCKKLRRLETKANKIALDYCNGIIDYDAAENQSNKILEDLDKVLQYKKLKIPLLFNFDARGYALKIESAWMRKKNYPLEKDWGGNGIIAPDLTPVKN